MKKLFFLIALAICPQVFGQNIDVNLALQNAATELSSLKQELGLNAEQEGQIKLVLDGLHQKYAYVNADQHLSPAQKEEAHRENTKVKHAYILQYLNDNQKTVYKNSIGQ